MSLRDALAAALIAHTGWLKIPGGGRAHAAQWSDHLSDAILSDPAFRTALTEAVAEAIAKEQDDWMVSHMAMEPGEFPPATPEPFMERAAEFVARMLS